jgi:hypothetical protein
MKTPQESPLARCPACSLDIAHADSCTVDTVRIDKVVYTRDTTAYDEGERCHDCNIKNRSGHVHHLQCSVERCPKCGHQLMSCGYV